MVACGYRLMPFMVDKLSVPCRRPRWPGHGASLIMTVGVDGVSGLERL
jgi:hypothetical protein